MDQVATNVNHQLKTKKQAKMPTDKYLKNKHTSKGEESIIQTTDEVLRMISRNLAGLKKSEKQAKREE